MDISEWKKYLCMQKISIPPLKLSVLVLLFFILGFSMRYQFYLFFQKLYIWVNGHSRMAKIFLHAKNQHPIFKIIRFRTLSYCFFIWAFPWGINFIYFFKNHISELMDISEWKKYPCMQKISILPSNLSILEPYFSFLKGAILT